MSSLALMRWLESASGRYDAGMRFLTLGRVTPMRNSVAREAVPTPAREVLEIGCGTGGVTLLLVKLAVHVTAIDQNPEMLEQARRRLLDASPGSVELVERSAAEIDGLPGAGFDAVLARLSLSERSRSERHFVLREARNRLRPGGLLVVGDEVKPRAAWQRLLHALLRAPQSLLGWLLVGSISHAIAGLPGEPRSAGFTVRGEECWLLGSLAAVTAERKP